MVVNLLMKERVLVVGANGFIGSNLVSELISNDIPVTALVKINTNTIPLKKIGCYNIISSNNFNDTSVIRQLAVSSPKYVVNCSWEKSSNDKIKSLENTRNLIDLLQLTKNINSIGFVNLGSYEEYGKIEGTIDENIIPKPITNFGKLKYGHCLNLRQIARDLNINFCHLRLGEVYSSKSNGQFLFSNLIKIIASEAKPVITDIQNKIDFIEVSDVSRGIIKLIESNANGVFNIGTGNSYPNKDLINMVIKQIKPSCKPKFTEGKDLINFSLNISKIYKQTGWKPSINIWDGISMLIQEEKFKSPNTFESFTDTIRSIYKN